MDVDGVGFESAWRDSFVPPELAVFSLRSPFESYAGGNKWGFQTRHGPSRAVDDDV